MHLIDTHTHLYSEKFNDDREERIKGAINAGVLQFFMPNIDSTSVKGMKDLVNKYPDHCFAMMGLHPCSVGSNVEEELQLVELELKTGKFIAVGEIGMDLYWDKSFQKEQEMAFRKQIQWAKQLNLPIDIHCRDAFEEILAIMDDENDENMRGVFHCFTGTLEQARHILNYGGFKLGIGGVVTFKNSGLDKVVKELGLKNIVLETDSPYLAPTPYRGKRNESAYLLNVADKISDIFEVSVAKVAEITTKNAIQIFQP
ncbi:TatD family hydrolase [bacterium]|nr:TatD family hydrolase [Vicingaceae bacterium]MDC0004985.1 TatD family hydrolase [bacterium]